MVDETAKQLGLRSRPEAFIVNRNISPMILLGRQARMLIPRKLWVSVGRDGPAGGCVPRAGTLAAASITGCAGWKTLVSSLYWWHPMVWWIRHRIHEEAEQACDAWVTWLLPKGRRAYAQALILSKQMASEQECPVPAVGMGMAKGRAQRFGRRLTMVMTQSRKPGLSVSGIAMVLAMAMVGWLTVSRSILPAQGQGRGESQV